MDENTTYSWTPGNPPKPPKKKPNLPDFKKLSRYITLVFLLMIVIFSRKTRVI